MDRHIVHIVEPSSGVVAVHLNKPRDPVVHLCLATLLCHQPVSAQPSIHPEPAGLPTLNSAPAEPKPTLNFAQIYSIVRAF